MKVVILCGGEGTRMKEETEFKPKPLVEVGGKPILWHIMKIYSYYGFNEFVVALGYKGNMIKDYFLNARTHISDFTLETKTQTTTFHGNGEDDFKITFVDTGLKSLTGERVRRLEKYIDGDEFMLTYGDGVADINIKELLEFHKSQNTQATITGVRPQTRYGIIRHDPQTNKVMEFNQNSIGTYREDTQKHDFIINGGFMVLKKSVISLIEPDSMVEEIFPKLASVGQVSLYRHEGKWKAMDTYKEVEEMNEYWKKEPFWKVWEKNKVNNMETSTSKISVHALDSFITNAAPELNTANPMPANFLQGKNILVTGGTGLVGSHLVSRLVELGANVFCTVRSKNPKSLFYQKQLDRAVVSVDCDVNYADRVLEVVSKYEIELIFHLAAQPIVATSFIDPKGTFDTNISGTVNILEAARRSPYIKGVIVASSDKAYGKNCMDATEDQPLAGDHPYDVSKSAADLITKSYYNTYRLPVVVTRFGNIFGPGDLNLNRIVPGVMKSIINNEQLEIRSDGMFVRDYLYVKDVVEGYIAVAAHIDQVKGEAFNFSTGYNFSVLGLISKISETLGKECRYLLKNNQVNEIPFQSLNFDKATNMLGWKPSYTLEQGIVETYDWYKNYLFQIR